MLEFYDEFGARYELPLSCTFDNSLMTTYSFLEHEASNIVLDRKDNTVRMLPCQSVCPLGGPSRSGKEVAGCEFVKNWLNYELNIGVEQFPECFVGSEGEFFYRMVTRMSGCELVRRFEGSSSENFSSSIYAYYS